jgi:hypothetical protein
LLPGPLCWQQCRGVFLVRGVMPTRLIREGIINSDRINELDWPAEVFYRRLLNKVDDHGLYDARPSVLRTSLYPLRVDRVREADCSRWIAACEKAGLIVLYEAENKPYLKVLDTRWQTRSEPKYPQPSAAVRNSKQLKTPVPVVGVVVEVEDVGVLAEGSRKNGARHASTDSSPVIQTLPLREGGDFQVHQSFIAELEPLYPAVDVAATIGEMKGWLIGHPTRRKTRRGVTAFVTRWLQQEQEKAGGV